MKGYCQSCKKYVQGVKKKFSVTALFLTLGFYAIYRIFVFRNRCPICGTKIYEKDMEEKRK